MKHFLSITFLTLLAVFIVLGFSYCQGPRSATTETINLFNGNDLTGWHVDVPEMDTNHMLKSPFLVRNHELVSMGEPNGHLITDAVYHDYIIDAEYRFVDSPGNCGILVHASTPRILYKMFPKSLEVQMMSQNGGDFWCIGEDIKVPDMEKRRGPKENWGVIEGKGRRILNLTDGSEKPLGEWNHLKIECKGNSVKVWMNDTMVNEGTECTASRGQIAVQAEGAKVAFRKLTLRHL